MKPAPERVPLLTRSLAAMELLFAGSACAAEGTSGTAFGVFQMILGLGFVLGLIVFASWLLRRYGAGPAATGSLVRVITAASVGPRERVVLVEVQDTWLVLGVAPGRVSALHQLPRQALPEISTDTPQGFARWLADARKRQSAAGKDSAE